MAKLLFDVNRQLDTPTLILEAKSGKRYGALDGTTSLEYVKNFNAPNEISFDLSKYINGKVNRLWDDVTDFKVIYIPEYKEKFQITPRYYDDEQEKKSLSGIDLCVAELSQTKIRDLEINTKTDLERHINLENGEYQRTTFYNAENPELSLLHRVLSPKCSHYTITHVDETLCDLAFEFAADDVSVYDFLTGDVAEKMQCLFLFDSMTRSIEVRDLCSTCNDCYEELIGRPESEWKHYRDDFHDVCPICGSTNITKGYGKDTAVLVDKENIATSIQVESDSDSVKNCLYVNGGDELINATFAMCNPSGDNYIIYFTDEMMKEMPDEFKSAWNDYCDLYEEYNTDYDKFNIDSNVIASFDNVVKTVSSLSDKEPFINYKNHTTPTLKGMKSLTVAYYNAVDIESFIKTSMSPSYEILKYDKYQALSMLNANNIGIIGIAGLDENTTKSYIDSAVKLVAKTLINTGLYDVEIESSTYSAGTWNGVFSVKDRQNDDDETNTITNVNYKDIASKEGKVESELPIIPSSVTLTINGDIETYCKNNIQKIVAKNDLPVSEELYSLTITDDYFKSMIPLYSIANLGIIKNTLKSCCEVLEDQFTNTNDSNTTVVGKLEEYRTTYYNRMEYAQKEIDLKYSYLTTISNYMDALKSQIDKIHDVLNLKDFMKAYSSDKNLWDILNYYRREDTYTNDNIISDNLESDNASLVQQANYLMKFAEKELIKASTPQMTISGNLYNLLMFPEFEPLLESFEVGNWIRVRTDINEEKDEDSIYKLRLLSYRIRFDEKETIDVEFSTVTQTWSGMRDAQSILDSAQAMGTNFDSVKKEVEKSVSTTDTVNGWVNDGLDLTNQRIISSASNQGTLIDEHGILCRKYYDITDSYDDCQLKIFNNGLYTTHDNWKTIDAGVGKFMWKNPDNDWQEEETYGIIARKIVGEMILGEEARFINDSGTMSFTESGLSVTSKNGLNVVNINPNADTAFEILKSEKQQLFIDTNGDINLGNGAKISWTTINGDNGESLTEITKNTIRTTDVVAENLVVKAAKIDGVLTASQIESGTIHAGSVDAEKIMGTTITGKTITGGTITGNTINNGNGTFYVDKDGNLIATKATIEGKITATSGAIANWTIIGNRIECDKTSEGGYRSGMQSLGSNGSAAFYAGTSTEAGGKIASTDASEFYVTQDGKLYANKATIKGTITAETLKIKNKIYLYNDDESKYMQFVDYDVSEMITFGTPSQNSMYFEPVVQFNQGFYSQGDCEFESKVSFYDNIYLSKNWNYSGDGVSEAQYIFTYWADGERHSILSINKDLLTTGIGWEGSSTYKTILNLRSRTVNVVDSSGTSSISDERLKNSLNELDEFDNVFMDLKPISFKYNNGSSGRKHFGFGAAQVRDTFLNHGFTTKDFGGFVQMSVEENNEDYNGITDPMGLIYTEFPAWNTHMIQKTIKKLNETKKELADLQDKYNKLAEFVGFTE